MSTVRVNRLIGNSDHNFEIQMPSSANLLVNGSYTADIDSGLVLPVGTTGQRPASPTAGMIRYNSTLETVEGYNGTDWINLMASDAGATATSSADIVRKNLVIWYDANNPRSLIIAKIKSEHRIILD